jgi:predicted nucleic acid-binding protein
LILVDTSVWLTHFRLGDAKLTHMLVNGAAGLHPFVVGEIAAGNLRKRAETLANLALLPVIPIAKESEVHHLLESQRLWATGLGWVDLHLLTSAKLFGWKIYTHDQAMNAAAVRFAIDHSPA